MRLERDSQRVAWQRFRKERKGRDSSYPAFPQCRGPEHISPLKGKRLRVVSKSEILSVGVRTRTSERPDSLWRGRPAGACRAYERPATRRLGGRPRPTILCREAGE
jgi:hypothetical protein